jgi:hypothetical protein
MYSAVWTGPKGPPVAASSARHVKDDWAMRSAAHAADTCPNHVPDTLLQEPGRGTYATSGTPRVTRRSTPPQHEHDVVDFQILLVDSQVRRFSIREVLLTVQVGFNASRRLSRPNPGLGRIRVARDYGYKTDRPCVSPWPVAPTTLTLRDVGSLTPTPTPTAKGVGAEGVEPSTKA